MRKIGAHVSSAGGPVNAIKNIQAIGGNCLQIFAGSPRMWARRLYDSNSVNKFNQLADQKGLRPLFIHALYLVNLASDNPDLLQKSFDSLLIDIQNGDQLQAAGIIVHLGSHQGRGFDSARDQIVTQIQKLLSQSQTTPFIIENSAGQQGKIGSLEEIKTLVDQINSPRVQICLDSAHLFSAGFDLRQASVVDQLVSQLAKYNLTERLTVLHLNDSAVPFDSGRDQHANLGEGTIGLSGLSNFVNHPQLNHLPLILEVPGANKKGPDAKNIQAAQSLIS